MVMSVEKHARQCSCRYLFGAAVFVAALAACEQGTNEEPATPITKSRTQDKTEVTMEISAPPAPSSPESPPSAKNALATTGSSSNTSTGAKPDPSEDPNIGGVQEPSVEKGIAPIRPQIRVCYKKALNSDPTLGGNATLDATLGKDGKVTNVRFVKRDGLNEDIIGCLLTAVKHATFDANQNTKIITFSFGSAPSPVVAPAADAGAKR
jgi:hypothetical protein